jgi:hypothetical protein
MSYSFSTTSVGNGTARAAAMAFDSGATLRNNRNSLTATFASGSIVTSSGEMSSAGVTTQTLARIEYHDLTFSVDGVTYVATGHYQNQLASGVWTLSGEVLLKQAGVTVGRIYVLNGVLMVQAGDRSQPL